MTERVQPVLAVSGNWREHRQGVKDDCAWHMHDALPGDLVCETEGKDDG